MKILIATGLYPPEIGGPATYTAILERELPKKNVAVAVLPFRAVRSYPKGIAHLVYAYKTWRIARRVDIVLALDPVSVGLPAYIGARCAGKKFVLRVAGDYAWEQWMQSRASDDPFVSIELFQKKEVSLKYRVVRYIERCIAQSAQRIIVPSAYLKSVVALWGVSGKNISVIANSFEPPSSACFIADFAIPENHILIVSAGRFVPWKGFREVISAIMTLRQQGLPVYLALAGDGPLLSVIQKEVAGAEGKDCIVFLGALSKERLNALVARADIFVLASGYEGFSHQLLEAQALGTPVVATRICGNPETVQEGKSGLLVPYGDQQALMQALRALVEDSALRARLGAGGKAFARNFSVENMTNRVNVLLHGV